MGPVGKMCCSPHKTAKMVPSPSLQRWRGTLPLSVTQRWFSNSLTFWANGDKFSIWVWGPSTRQLKASRLSLSPGTLTSTTSGGNTCVQVMMRFLVQVGFFKILIYGNIWVYRSLSLM